MMRRRGAASLRGLIMATCFAAIGLLLLFMLLMLVPRVTQLLTANAVERTRETLLQSAKSVNQYISGITNTLHFASTLMPEAGADDAAWQEQARLLQQNNADLVSISYFDADGGLIYSTAGGLRNPNTPTASEDWFTKAIEWEGTAAYFSRPHVQNLFDAPHAYVLSISKAFLYSSSDGTQRYGVLLIDLSPSTLASLAGGVRLGESGYAFILDEQDGLIWHPRQQQIYAGLYDESLDSIKAQIVGITKDSVDGRERVLISMSLNQTRWRMVGSAYVDEIFGVLSAIVRIITAALICGMLFSFVAATLIALLIERPIRGLEQEILRVRGGDLADIQLPRSFRELRSLALAFNDMLARIRGLMRQIVEEQEAKRLHELNALQAQINPHFLYNTLDSIIWMEESGHSKEAVQMVNALAKLFRISISKGHSFITVDDELQHVGSYLVIQKMRFQNKFSYEIEPAADTLRLYTLRLIVQPLVENAITHAIDEYGDPLHIRISTAIVEDELHIVVADDGLGIPAAKQKTILTTSTGKSGIGIKNVHERIQLTYGAKYGLTIESVEDEGTTVTIRLPVSFARKEEGA